MKKLSLWILLAFGSITGCLYAFPWGSNNEENVRPSEDRGIVPKSDSQQPRKSTPKKTPDQQPTSHPTATSAEKSADTPIWGKDEKIQALEEQLQRYKNQVALYDKSLSELRSIVVAFGLPGGKAATMQMPELLSELRIRLGNNRRYSGAVLSDKNLLDLSDYLTDTPEMLRTMRDYDAFIKSLSGKQVIIIDLPGKE